MQKEGHDFLFTCREKEFEIYLIKQFGFNYKSIGKKFKSSLGKILGLVIFNTKLFNISLKFKPDLFISHGSIYAAHVSFLLRKPHVCLEDTGNMEQVRLYLPFSKYIITSTAFQKDLGKKQIRHNSFHELAYLHPKYFTPDPNIYKELGLSSKEKFCLVRFIGWNASHDIDVKGLNDENKIEIVNRLSKYCKVFVSSEGEVPKEISKYLLKTKPERIHHVLSYASLLIGESGTMTSECAILGTPAIQISGLPKGSIGVLAEQEEYGLVTIYEYFSKEVLDKAVEFIVDEKKMKIINNRNRMISEKTDLTLFLINSVNSIKLNVDG